jgi:hypothetical protein
MVQRSGTGIAGLAIAIGSGSSWMIAARVCAAVGFRKGALPVAISYNTAPNEN